MLCSTIQASQPTVSTHLSCVRKRCPETPTMSPRSRSWNKLECLLSHHVQFDVKLQPRAIARDVRKGRFSMWPKRDNSSRHADIYGIGGEFLRRAISVSFNDLPSRMRPGELPRVTRNAPWLRFRLASCDAAETGQAVQIPMGHNPFGKLASRLSAIALVRAAARSIAVGFHERQENASCGNQWYNPPPTWGERVRS